MIGMQLEVQSLHNDVTDVVGVLLKQYGSKDQALRHIKWDYKWCWGISIIYYQLRPIFDVYDVIHIKILPERANHLCMSCKIVSKAANDFFRSEIPTLIQCLATFLPRYSTVSLVDILKVGKIRGTYSSLRKQGGYFPVLDNEVPIWPITGMLY